MKLYRMKLMAANFLWSQTKWHRSYSGAFIEIWDTWPNAYPVRQLTETRNVGLIKWLLRDQKGSPDQAIYHK